MFGIFGVTKDANKAHGYLLNFSNFALESLAIFGFEKGASMLSKSEWVAGPKVTSERGYKFLQFRLCVPFESFYGIVDNETRDSSASKVTITGVDEFLGFRLCVFTDSDLVQVSANNSYQRNATARACMLMARFKSKGATDISKFLDGRY